MIRRRYEIIGLIVVLLLALDRRASSAGTGQIDILFRQWLGGQPIGGVSVTISSDTTEKIGVSRPDGTLIFTDLPVGTYTVTVHKYLTDHRDYEVSEDQVTVVRVALAAVGPVPVQMQPEEQFPKTSPGAKTIHDSILGFYNDDHPAHVGKEPFFGRYSYVVLRDGDETTQAKNSAFVRKLVDKYSPTNSRIGFFDPTDPTDNPFSYNVFFFPVHKETSVIDVLSHSGTATEILNAYDFKKAGNLREAYCEVPTHEGRPLCTPPYSDGPFLFTFFRPLPETPSKANIPPAFAYDFTDVLPEQLDEPLDVVQVKIGVAANISTDDVLPPPMAAHVASMLEVFATALNAGFSGVHDLIDKQPGTKGAEH